MGFAQSAALKKLASSRRLHWKLLSGQQKLWIFGDRCYQPSVRAQPSRIFCQQFYQHTVRTQLTSILWLRFSRVCFQTLQFFDKFYVFWNMFSVDFGTLSCEGYPQRLTRESIVRPSGAIWCLGVLFHRFVIDFGVHFGRHFRTCCIISGIQFQSVFLKASRDALVMILAPFGEPFWKHFRQVFRNRWNLDFDDPSNAKVTI